MNAENSTSIKIEIMGKQHQFTCSIEQAEDLRQAANNLVVMCNNIKTNSGVVGSERALLVASLNLSYSLLIANKEVEGFKQGQASLISTLKNAL